MLPLGSSHWIIPYSRESRESGGLSHCVICLVGTDLSIPCVSLPVLGLRSVIHVA